LRAFSKILSIVLVLSLCLFARAQEGKREDDDRRERDAYEQQLNSTDGFSVAKARLDAYFFLPQIPQWRDAQGAVPQWQEIGPRVLKNGWGGWDNSGRICALVIDPRNPRILFAGAASGGVWKSEDEGKTWRPLGDFAASLSVGAMAIDPFRPDILYAGTGEAHYSIDSYHGAGFLRSFDGGRTWDLTASDVFLGYHFTKVIPNRSRPGFIYASTTRGVFRSLDYGGTWVQLLAGSASDLIVDPRDPNTLIAALGFAWGSPKNGLYLSRDAGATWIKLSADLPRDYRSIGRIQLTECALYPNVVYASLYGTSGGLQGFYKTTDFGASWSRKPNAPSYAGDSAWYSNCIAVSPTNPNVVFAGGFSTFRTLDGGDTWEDNTRSYGDGQVHPDHHSFTFSNADPNTLYLATDGGVFRTSDIGKTWESISDGLGTIQFQSVDVHPWDQNIAYGGTQDNGTNNYTGSTAWTNHFLGDGGTTRVNFRNPNVVYTEYVNLTICKSTNAGVDWSWNTTDGIDPNEGKLFYAPFNLDPNDPDILVAGAQKVYRSTNAATNWQAISPILGSRVSAVTVAPNHSEVIYAGTSDGKLWVTPNTGKDWYNVTKGLPRAFVNDICIDPRDSRTVYVALSGWDGERIWKSVNAGGTWTSIGGRLPGMPIQAICLDPRRPETVYLATYMGVFVSTTGGGSWCRFGSGLPNCPVFSIVANLRTGWITVGTHGRGAWRIPIGD
jgi:photosystem II stability/assembly factor-like uncharacterized protein